MDSQSTKSGSNLVLPGVVALVVIALIAGGFFLFQSNSLNQTQNPVDDTQTPVVSNPPSDGSTQSAEETSSYKDGTYTATGNYTSPGGAEELGVSITLENGVVTDSTVESRATRPNSVRFQGLFVSNYKQLVVGKKIDEISLSKVSGSSLAPKGFNEALEEIKQQARS